MNVVDFHHWVKSYGGLAIPGKKAVPPIHNLMSWRTILQCKIVKLAGEGSAINRSTLSSLLRTNLNWQPD